MMYDIKTILGIAAVVIGLIGYVPYYRDVLRGTTKPHPFTWIGLSLLLGITFFAQLQTGGGPGAWVNGVSAFGVFGIALLAIAKGERDITRFDWMCFVGAFLGIVLWRIVGDPLVAVVIVTITDTVVFAPTYRKAYLRPHEETTSLYVLAAVKLAVSLFALQSFNFTTALFPVTVMIMNASFVILLVFRRRQLAKR